VGILIGVAYTLRVVGKAFFSETDPIGAKDLDAAPAQATSAPLEPISIPERIGAAILIVATVVIGLYPRLLLDLIVPALQSPLFEPLRRDIGP
jgi:NADH-quinone oxidoreductase subunit M